MDGKAPRAAGEDADDEAADPVQNFDENPKISANWTEMTSEDGDTCKSAILYHDCFSNSLVYGSDKV